MKAGGSVQHESLVFPGKKFSDVVIIGLFLSIPFVFHVPLTIGCSNRYFSIASLISGVDWLEVIKVIKELLANAVKCCLNECLRACCCLPRLSQTALSNHRLNYNISTHGNTSLRSLIWSNPETIISKE